MNMLPENLHLLRPLWLLLLLAAPALWWALGRAQRDGGDWARACDTHLLPHLLEARGERASRAPQWLAVAALLLAALALAGPAWERLPESLQRQESALVLVLDLSASSLATDLKPNRLARARFKLADLFRLRPDGQTALVAYAGQAFTVAPLTDDSNTIANLVEALDPELMPVAGKRADLALRHAEQLLRGAGMERGDVLLITDRVEPRDRAVAADLATRGIRVSVLGLGGTSAAPVPLTGGGFVMDEQGRPLLAKLDASSLRELAANGGGAFAAYSTDNSDLLALGLDEVKSGVMRDAQGEAQRFRDAGFWLLPPLMLLVLLAFRRGWLAVVFLFPLAIPLPAQAFEWNDLWQRRDQQAAEALREGDIDRARSLAEDAAWRGAAAYRDEDWSAAAEAFAEREAASAHYNRGNALAKAGSFQEAMGAYRSALQKQPDFEDAQANLEAVQRWLEQQPPKSEEESGDGEKDESGEQGESGSPQSSEAEQGSDSEQPESGEQGEQGEAPEGEEPGATDQQQEGDQSSGEEDSDKQSESPDQSAEMDDSEPQEGDESQQALSEAIDQALAEQAEQEPPSEAEPLSAEERADAERRQSVEQWLRRVPDDPGALLRRKFALEHQRRLREGIE